ncbi:MAG: double zinc ribbon domain-containing protein, partial [Armatimonadaceae bacterium]
MAGLDDNGAVACPGCSQKSPSGNRFCGHCGAALAVACGGCGRENPRDHRFCGGC